MTLDAYHGLNTYLGDLHSHCNIGYGRGSIEQAYRNARLQLDFASVVAHAVWPDMPMGEPGLEHIVRYHQEGFRRAAAQWPHLQQVCEQVNEPGRFVTFPAFEWHSLRYGDHNVYFDSPTGEIIDAPDLETLRAELRRLTEQGVRGFALPHHIGYRPGYRGIDWDAYSPEFSPVVEMFSMHGLAEADDAPYPYLHTMGPRDGRSTVQHGLTDGHVFGMIGSTDHHSAHPGSYGQGRAAVWANDLTRASLWDAIAQRRVYALTGDRIEVQFAINGELMGSVLPAAAERRIEFDVVGGDAIDYIDLVHNGCVLQRWNPPLEQPAPSENRPANSGSGGWKLLFEMGWGPKRQQVDWETELTVAGGRLMSIEPRLRGPNILSPLDEQHKSLEFSQWEWVGEQAVRLSTRTWGNPTNTTAGTQGVALEIEGGADTRIQATINGEQIEMPLAELIAGPRAGYLGGFLSPAWCLHQAVPRAAYTASGTFMHQAGANERQRDWYYLRVAQKNGQWAWTSPIWIGG